jgi:hypothetical protein
MLLHGIPRVIARGTTRVASLLGINRWHYSLEKVAVFKKKLVDR